MRPSTSVILLIRPWTSHPFFMPSFDIASSFLSVLRHRVFGHAVLAHLSCATPLERRQADARGREPRSGAERENLCHFSGSLPKVVQALVAISTTMPSTSRYGRRSFFLEQIAVMNHGPLGCRSDLGLRMAVSPRVRAFVVIDEQVRSLPAPRAGLSSARGWRRQAIRETHRRGSAMLG